MGMTEKVKMEEILDKADEIFLGKNKSNEEYISNSIYYLIDIAKGLGNDSLSRFLHYLEEAYGFYI